MKKSLLRSAILFAFLSLLAACGGESKPATPIETFKTYTKAIKAKDTTTMKLLLSKATIEMHQLEAQAQGVTVDDIVKRETLFTESQKTVKLRNEKIEGDAATLEVENSFGSWEMVPFVKEDGVWKIDKKGYAQRMMDEADRQNKELDEKINQMRQQP
ncbi:MAG: DUF4878 domain-containing protein [Acidobacteria bacterium]|nr:DUF4878 domain-containing protein [Acidobacteriota bacterium]